MNAATAALTAVLGIVCMAGAIIMHREGNNTLATVLGTAAAAGFAAIYKAATKAIEQATRQAVEAKEKAAEAERRAQQSFEETQTLRRQIDEGKQ